MGDAWLIIGIFAFAFVLWASTGGPDRPISFAGPYITPITDVGDIQEGYGEDSWGIRSLWSSRSSGSRDTEEDAGTPSPAQGDVSIVSGAGGPSSSDPATEYIAIRASSAPGDIDITGWRLVSLKTGAEARIAQGTVTPGSSVTSNIILHPSDEAIITTGSSPAGSSFRENMCTGYFASTRTYVPRLENSCPSPTQELGDFFEGTATNYDSCREYVSEFSRCETATVTGSMPSACRRFIEDRLNYAGCVRVHQSDPGFMGDRWRIYLGSSKQLWRSDNETIRLLDREGRTVDQYSY